MYVERHKFCFFAHAKQTLFIISTSVLHQLFPHLTTKLRIEELKLLLQISALGMGFCISSYSLALNMYFTKNRNRATGIALTVTGLGPILMPQLISYLMSVNTPQETIFIIGGISLNCFVSALLMQPVKWHMKEAIEEENGAILDDAPDKCEETEDKIERHLKPLLEEGNIIYFIMPQTALILFLHRCGSWPPETPTIFAKTQTKKFATGL